jgi:hypothetical protein
MKRLGVFDDDIIIILNFSISQKNGERTYKHTEHANKRANEHKNEHMNEPHPKKTSFYDLHFSVCLAGCKKRFSTKIIWIFSEKKINSFFCLFLETVKISLQLSDKGEKKCRNLFFPKTTFFLLFFKTRLPIYFCYGFQHLLAIFNNSKQLNLLKQYCYINYF